MGNTLMMILPSIVKNVELKDNLANAYTLAKWGLWKENPYHSWKGQDHTIRKWITFEFLVKSNIFYYKQWFELITITS